MEIREELKSYIEKDIFEIYKLNEEGHSIGHIQYVVRRSLKFSHNIKDINQEMMYVIAAYHDIGHHIDAKKHEIISAKMLKEDEKIRQFFSKEQIKIMCEAIEDHRSSADSESRSIYGKIVSSADRNTSVWATLKRAYSYTKTHFPELNEEEVIEECREFLLKKFGRNGYARDKMYFEDNEYSQYLEDMTELAENKKLFNAKIREANSIEMKIYNLKNKLEYLDEVANLEYEEWANDKEENKQKRIEIKKEKIINMFSNEYFCKLILVNGDELVGFVSIFPEDCEEEKDLSPWYATMYIKKKYRKQGYSKILNKAILFEAKKRGFKILYLKTDLKNYYEKFGAIYIKKLKTNEFLYKFEL